MGGIPDPWVQMIVTFGAVVVLFYVLRQIIDDKGGLSPRREVTTAERRESEALARDAASTVAVRELTGAVDDLASVVEKAVARIEVVAAEVRAERRERDR